MKIRLRQEFLAALGRQRVGRELAEMVVPGGPWWCYHHLPLFRRWLEELAVDIRRRLEAGEAPSPRLMEEELLRRLAPYPPPPPPRWLVAARRRGSGPPPVIVVEDPDEEGEEDVQVVRVERPRVHLLRDE